MDMAKFTSAMLDAIAHCAREVQIASDWRLVCAADMRDAYMDGRIGFMSATNQRPRRPSLCGL